MEVDVDSKVISLAERRLVGRFVRTFFFRNRRGGPWPVPDWLPHERVAFDGNTGARLAGRWFPARRARGVVVLAHPDRRYGQHWFVLSGWIDHLHDLGFHALTFDFPDYGESRGGSTYYPEDVRAAVAEARRRAPDLPLHLVGVSMGAFAAANASPFLEGVESLVLESVYPSFNAWYGRGPGRWGMAAFDRLFPRTARLIQADQNIARARARRILVAASSADRVTPAALSRRVAAAAPRDRTRYLEFDGVAHLDLFAEAPGYRDAVIEALTGAAPTHGRNLLSPHGLVSGRWRRTQPVASDGPSSSSAPDSRTSRPTTPASAS